MLGLVNQSADVPSKYRGVIHPLIDADADVKRTQCHLSKYISEMRRNVATHGVHLLIVLSSTDSFTALNAVKT